MTFTDSDAGDEQAEGALTRLDRLWLAACAEADAPDDAATLGFLEALLAEPLLCPIADEAEADETGAPSAIRPLVIERDGRETVLLFDDEERLAAFVDRPTPFVALSGRSVFRMVAGAGVDVALNLDVAPSSTVFSAETVAAVAELADASEEVVEIAGGARLRLGPPDAPPEAFLRALTARLAAAAAVSEAWLVAVHDAEPEADTADAEDDDAGSGLALALAPRAGVAPAALEGLAKELGRLAGAFADRLDVGVIAPGDPFGERLLATARRVGLGVAVA